MQQFQQPSNSELATRRDQVPDQLLTACPICHIATTTATLPVEKYCPNCGYGFRIGAQERIDQLCDQFTPWDTDLTVPEKFDNAKYRKKLRNAIKQTGQQESVDTGLATIGGQTCGLGVMDPNFIMGSLGSATGEKITRLFERCTLQKRPVVMITASGGARMQEGMASLMQMAKVSAAVAQHRAAGLVYIVVLTDPTTGGVTASFAMQADITLSEPHALIGFAGRRVIEQTIQQQPPKDFQQAETLMQHGWLDQIVARPALKATLAKLLKWHQPMGGLADD